MEPKKARTIAEVAALYQVSAAAFERQIGNYVALRNALKHEGFFGDYLYPLHQRIVFRYLGDPMEEEDSITEIIEEEKEKENEKEEAEE